MRRTAVRRVTFRSLVAVLVLLSQVALAVECPAPAGAVAELGQIDAQQRLHFIQQSLARDAKRASVWTWSWVAVNAALVAYQVPMAFPQVGDRIFQTGAYSPPGMPSPSATPSFAIGSGLSALSLALMFVLPVTVRWAPRNYEDRVAMGEDACHVLAEAEQRLFDDADNEDSGIKWYWHLINLALNGAATLVIGLGFKDWSFGTLVGVSGMALGTAQILTQPTRLITDAQEYKAGRPAPSNAGSYFFTFAPALNRMGGGLAQGGVLAFGGTF